MKTFSRKANKLAQQEHAVQQAVQQLDDATEPSNSTSSSGSVQTHFGTPLDSTPSSKLPVQQPQAHRLAYQADKENDSLQPQPAFRTQPAVRGSKVAIQYTRKVAPKTTNQRDAAVHSQFIATMRAHFAEVDDFELAEESPQPWGYRPSDSPAHASAQPALLATPGSPDQHSDPASPARQQSGPFAANAVDLDARLLALDSPERLASLSPLSSLGTPADRKAPQSAVSGSDLLQRLHAPESPDSLLDSPQQSSALLAADAETAPAAQSGCTATAAGDQLAHGPWSPSSPGHASASTPCSSESLPARHRDPAAQVAQEPGSEGGADVAAVAPAWQAAPQHALTPVTEGSEASPSASDVSSLHTSSRMDTPGTSAASPKRSSQPSHPQPPTPRSVKPMALGLSRRSSVLVNHLDSAQRPSLGPSRFSLAAENDAPASARRMSHLPNAREAGLSHARQSLIGRLSTRFSIGDGLARLSAGFTDTLQYMGLMPCKPDEEGSHQQEASRLSSASQDHQRRFSVAVPTSFVPGGLAGIAESPQLAECDSCAASADAESHTPPSTQAMAASVREHAVSQDDAAAAALYLELEAKLSIEASPAAAEAALSPMQQLLKLCGQPLDVDSVPSMAELLGRHVDLTQIRKIGEGTFGEAFKAGKVVFKIVPMEGALLVNGETQKLAAEILAEVAISLTLSELRAKPGGAAPFGTANVTSGFVETFGVGICRGQYAEALRREWHAWDDLNESENDPVDDFPADQLYVVFVVADGGADLEHFDVRSFDEAKSILLQVALTLAVAEEACQFEHRDLHWGNLLIQRGAEATQHFLLRGTDIGMANAGVAVTLIDFTLSRLNTLTGETAFLDLSADPELFQGPKGDCQAETYRRMKKVTKDDWEAHRPETNTLWMHYLADTLLSLKKFPCTSADKREFRNFRKRAMSYHSCNELVWDEFFTGAWVAGTSN